MPADRYTMDGFARFVREQEAGEKHRGPDGRWMPYKDAADKWTVGRGHLINKGRSPDGYEMGLRDAQVETLFRNDLTAAVVSAQRAVGDDEWNRLDARRQLMLADFAFNVGENFAEPGKFPKFTQAVLNNDSPSIRRESTRHYRRNKTSPWKPLTKRNKDFGEFFELTQAYPDLTAKAHPTAPRVDTNLNIQMDVPDQGSRAAGQQPNKTEYGS